MNCETAQRLIHLNRPGERTTSEDAALQAHLLKCPGCTSAAERIGQFATLESHWRASMVEVPDLRHVRAKVLEETAGTVGPSRALFGFFLRIQSRPVVRASYGVAALALTIWFALGQTQVRMARASLVSRNVTAATRVAGPQVVYAVDHQTVSRAALLSDVDLPLAAPASGTMEVSQSELEEILRLTEHQVLKAVIHGAVSRARLTEIARTIEPAILVTIRFRPSGG